MFTVVVKGSIANIRRPSAVRLLLLIRIPVVGIITSPGGSLLPHLIVAKDVTATAGAHLATIGVAGIDAVSPTQLYLGDLSQVLRRNNVLPMEDYL